MPYAGMVNSRAHTLAIGRFSTSSITLPMYRLAINVHTNGPDSLNNSGPGCSPYDWNATRMTAAVADVGSPMVSSGTSTPAAAALLAASGPATPSMAPWPNSSGCLLSRFSVA